jgi:predicted RecA/RadA family phage recombinase
MKNLIIEEVKTLDAPAPTGGAVSGNAYLLGAILAVAITTAAAGVLISYRITGGAELPKATGAITIGAKLYWDDTNKVLTTTASGNTLCGVAAKAQASGDATAVLLLNFCP